MPTTQGFGQHEPLKGLIGHAISSVKLRIEIRQFPIALTSLIGAKPTH